jgi:phosphoserine phosphatase
MQKYAARYGIDMTPAEALKRVADGIGQENYAAKQQERLRQLSMTVHPYLKEHIAAGGTVEDVANVYANSKLYKLGVAVPTATKDRDVMNAIASGKTVADFERELQADPLWRRTDEARKLSADFTSTMLKTFGLG